MRKQESRSTRHREGKWHCPNEAAAYRQHGCSWAGPPRRSVLPGAASCPKARATSQSAGDLWVKQIGGRIVGVLRVADAGPGVARIVTFRIDPEWHHTTVLKDLIRAVRDYCHEHGCRKVLLDLGNAPPWMPSVLRQHGFRVKWHAGTWEALLPT